MKIYRVAFQTEGGISAGYRFFRNQREAERAAYAWKRDREPELDLPLIDVWDYPISAAGMLAALERLASHADNG